MTSSRMRKKSSTEVLADVLLEHRQDKFGRCVCGPHVGRDPWQIAMHLASSVEAAGWQVPDFVQKRASIIASDEGSNDDAFWGRFSDWSSR